jgi:4-amino-4-deoxy-L-arabinose transferase-like glycosyltransferase
MRLTPPEQRSRPSNFPQSSASIWRWCGAIAVVALAVCWTGLSDDSFTDEFAYITQSYYSDLFFAGRLDDPAWLNYFAFDLQPLPKYFIGIGLRAANLKMPQALDAAKWYASSTTFGPPRTLTVARIPFIAMGVLGCLAIFGWGVLLGGRVVGTIAAILLIVNPLYRLHAHRAMSDVPCEAFMAAALGLALWANRRIWSHQGVWSGLGLFGLAGLCLGLSIACKLNGLLAPIVMAGWLGLGLLLPRTGWRIKATLAVGTCLSMAVAGATFIALNPALTARPRGPVHASAYALPTEGIASRFGDMIRLRLESSEYQKKQMSHNALVTPTDKLAVFAVQGFGRCGPFGPRKSNSVIRYQLEQDWGLVIWWPMVVIGLIRAYRLGRIQLRDGAMPTAWALLIWAIAAWFVVAAYLPMAWDRYLLPIQAPNTLLAVVGMCGVWERWRGKAVDA